MKSAKKQIFFYIYYIESFLISYLIGINNIIYIFIPVFLYKYLINNQIIESWI